MLIINFKSIFRFSIFVSFYKPVHLDASIFPDQLDCLAVLHEPDLASIEWFTLSTRTALLLPCLPRSLALSLLRRAAAQFVTLVTA